MVLLTDWKIPIMIFPSKEGFLCVVHIIWQWRETYTNINRLTGDAGGGRGERLIIFLSFKSITIPIYEKNDKDTNKLNKL